MPVTTTTSTTAAVVEKAGAGFGLARVDLGPLRRDEVRRRGFGGEG